MEINKSLEAITQPAGEEPRESSESFIPLEIAKMDFEQAMQMANELADKLVALRDQGISYRDIEEIGDVRAVYPAGAKFFVSDLINDPRTRTTLEKPSLIQVQTYIVEASAVIRAIEHISQSKKAGYENTEEYEANRASALQEINTALHGLKQRELAKDLAKKEVEDWERKAEEEKQGRIEELLGKVQQAKDQKVERHGNEDGHPYIRMQKMNKLTKELDTMRIMDKKSFKRNLDNDFIVVVPDDLIECWAPEELSEDNPYASYGSKKDPKIAEQERRLSDRLHFGTEIKRRRKSGEDD